MAKPVKITVHVHRLDRRQRLIHFLGGLIVGGLVVGLLIGKATGYPNNTTVLLVTNTPSSLVAVPVVTRTPFFISPHGSGSRPKAPAPSPTSQFANIRRNVKPPNSILYDKLYYSQVAEYCQTSGYGFQTNGLDWFCTYSDQKIAFQLTVNDLDKICQRINNTTNAIAIQDGTGSLPIYQWRCYNYPPN